MAETVLYRIEGTDIRKNTRILLQASGLERLLEEKFRKRQKERNVAGEAVSRRDLRIVLKPNLVSPTPACFGATTHPEIAEEILLFLLERGYTNLTIAEGSWVGDSTEEAFEICGFRALAERYPVKLVDTKKDRVFAAEAGSLRMKLCEICRNTDFLINLPVLKGHCQVKMTCALKNLKGLIPDSEKRRFHQLGLHEPVALLNTLVHQDFILIDDICGDEYMEDGGCPSEKNRLLAGTDPVAADVYAAMELGLAPEEIPYLRKAAELGIGSLNGVNVCDLQETGISEKENPVRQERKTALTELIPKERKTLLDISYAVDDCETCSACYAALTGALLRLKEEGLSEQLPVRIGIGQGMRGKTGAFGIGNCTAGFTKFVRGCPPEEEDIYRMLKQVIREGNSRTAETGR